MWNYKVKGWMIMKIYELETKLELITGDSFTQTIMVSEDINKINRKAKNDIEERGNINEYFINIWEDGEYKKSYEYIYNEDDL